MNCPRDIEILIGKVLQVGLGKIRGYVFNGQTKQAHAEADHLHNLPEIFIDYQPFMLPFYWDSMRPGYLREVDPHRSTGYEEFWVELEPLVERERSHLTATSQQAGQPSTKPKRKWPWQK